MVEVRRLAGDPVLTRRQVLRVLGVGLAAAAVPGLGLSGCGGGGGGRAGSAAGRVVVVGGGLGGLATAWQLQQEGVEVTVLEATPAVGGRVRTWRVGDIYAEAGGEFVDGRHRHLMDLLDQVGLELEPVGTGTEDLDGVLLHRGRRRALSEVFSGGLGAGLDRVEEALLEAADGFPRLDDPAAHIDARSIDGRSVADLLDGLGLDAATRWLAGRLVVNEATVEPEDLSLLFWAQQVAAAAEDDVEAYRIGGGNAALAERLADELGDAVLLGTPATEIQVDAQGVTVRSHDTAFSAERVVLAVPPTVVDRIRMQGRTPDVLLTALAELHLGDATKVLAAFDDRHWRDAGYDGDAITDLELGATWEGPTGSAGGPLMALAGGAGAIELLALSQDITALHEQLRAVWPDAELPAPPTVHAVHWGAQPWTGGAFSAYGPGQVGRLWETLRRPHGRVHVAGEHTAAVAVGYMDGAVQSGLRAAAEVIDAR
jgi:monoamine oxidase